jgi:TolB-like protein
LQRLVAELRRRRVLRALLGWGVFSFAVLQVFEPVMHGLHLPEWTLSLAVVVLAAGFPATVVLAWIFDLGARGIERTLPAADDLEGGSATSRLGGAPLALLLVGLGLAAAAPGLWWYLLRQAPAASAPAGPGRAQAGKAAAPSVAVLPFVNLSSDKEQDYFADGIAEEILNVLAHVSGLRVTGRTSSFAFKGRSEDIRTIGQKLAVGAVLEGSVRKEGNRVRVTAQLVNVADGFHVWSKTFDRDLAGVFAIQDEIAAEVASALRLALLPDQAGGKGRRTPVAEAHDQYLLGRQLFAESTLDGYRGAIAAYERALSLDPGYAAAWAGLADAAFWLADGDPDATPELQVQAHRRALAAADRAVKLEPDGADGYGSRGTMRAVEWDWEGARQDLEKALSLRPGSAEVLTRYGILQATHGHVQQAIASIRRATEIDPLSAAAWWRLGWLYLGAGEIERGREAAQRAVQVSPGSIQAWRTLGFANLLAGRLEESAASFGDDHGFPFFRALVLDRQGRKAEADAIMKAAKASPNAPDYQMAEALAWRGEIDEAFRRLANGVPYRDPGLAYVTYDPFLAPLRKDPRYAELLRRMRLPAPGG